MYINKPLPRQTGIQDRRSCRTTGKSTGDPLCCPGNNLLSLVPWYTSSIPDQADESVAVIIIDYRQRGFRFCIEQRVRGAITSGEHQQMFVGN